MGEFDSTIAAYRAARATFAIQPGLGGGGIGDDDPLTSPPATGEERNWLQQLTHSLDGFTKSAEARIESRIAEDKAWAQEMADKVIRVAREMDFLMNKYAQDAKHDLADVVRRANAIGKLAFGGMAGLLWLGLGVLLIYALKD